MYHFFFFLKVEGVPGRSSCSLHMVLQRNLDEQCLTHPLSAGPPQTGCGLQTSLVVRTVVYPQPPVCFVPLSVLQLCLLCLALPERRLWASTTPHIWVGLIYPVFLACSILCATQQPGHTTQGKGLTVGTQGRTDKPSHFPFHMLMPLDCTQKQHLHSSCMVWTLHQLEGNLSVKAS